MIESTDSTITTTGAYRVIGAGPTIFSSWAETPGGQVCYSRLMITRPAACPARACPARIGNLPDRYHN